jgi:hypothetical protein
MIDPQISSIWISHTGIDEWTWRISWRRRVTSTREAWSGTEDSYPDALRAVAGAIEQHREDVADALAK